MLAGVVGTGLQLQQAELWAGWVYGFWVLFALVLCALAAIKRIAFVVRLGAVTLAMAALGFGATGLRGVAYMADTLSHDLEGRDLVVTGVVANLPQRNETGLRFRLQVESALLNGQPVRVPPCMDVGWYGSAVSSRPCCGDGRRNHRGRHPGANGINRESPGAHGARGRALANDLAP